MQLNSPTHLLRYLSPPAVVESINFSFKIQIFTGLNCVTVRNSMILFLVLMMKRGPRRWHVIIMKVGNLVPPRSIFFLVYCVDLSPNRFRFVAIFFCHKGMEPKGAFVGALLMTMLAKKEDHSNGGCVDTLLRETFLVFSNGKDVIDMSDLGLLLSKMGFPMSDEAEKKLLARVKKTQTNDVQVLTYDELVDLCAHELLCTDNDDLVEEVFQTIDTNSSGGISKSEFATCLVQLGQTTSTDRVNAIFAKYDTDGEADGQINLDEFKVIFDSFKEEIMGAHGRSMERRASQKNVDEGNLPVPPVK